MNNKQKDLWEKLAEENSRYYINSDKGRGITEEEFRDSGRNDYIEHIFSDEIVMDIPNVSLDPVTIIDLGCGTGRMTEFMNSDFDKVIGVDISSKMIKNGRKRLGKSSDIKLIESDGESIPLDDNSVDVVFSYLVFQHIKEKKMVEKNFEEVYRILRPDGLFKVRIRSDKVDVNKWWGGVNYTEQSIGKLIKEVGFDLLKTEPVKDYGFWLWLKK